MSSVDVEVAAGRVRAIPLPVTAVDVTLINGPVVLAGWSIREASGDIPRDAEGSVTSPAALAVIATLTGLAGGTYRVHWTISLAGTLAAGDANNFELTDTSGNVVQSVNLAVAGNYPQPDAVITVPSNGTITIEALAIGTVASVYSAELSIEPTITDEVVAEIRDGNNVIACIGLGTGGADTEYFGPFGLMPLNQITVHLVSGTLVGAVFALYDD